MDAETDPFDGSTIPVAFIFGLYRGDTDEYWEFESLEKLMNFLSDKNWLVYAHNGGKFDYHLKCIGEDKSFREYINSDEPLMMISGRMAKFRIGECEFRDSMNILVNPLRAFAKEEIDYQKLHKDVRHLHMVEIRKYLKSDCVNLWDTINAYNTRYGVSLTQAGASMRYWQKNHGTGFVKQTLSQSAIYREYYYGGRVQCFRQGTASSNFKVVDINSAYPFAMLHAHPFEPEARVQKHLPRVEHMGQCFVHLIAVAKGCFPLRTDDGLFFPDDERTPREYFVSGWELAAALELDAVKIIEIKKVHYFTQTVNFFDYINKFYVERKEAKAKGDKVGDVFAKLFMNSLYGKFAADPTSYMEYVIASDDSLSDWCTSKFKWDAKEKKNVVEEYGYRRNQPWGDRHLLERELPEKKHTYYNVATAASITGFVRAYLFRALRQCSGLIYCDTDSIAAESIEGLTLGKELGQWKHEADCVYYAVAGKKTYAFELTDGTYKTASKGVRLSPDEIIRAAEGEQVIYKPQAPTYSVMRENAVFVPRTVKMTAKDISQVR